MKKIIILDYGLGNLYSIQRAFEVCGANQVIISSDPSKIITADKLVLPGVGSFPNGMKNLLNDKLDIHIEKFVKSGKDILGICLGMQLFSSTSREFNLTKGLNLIPGDVVEIERQDYQGNLQKIPFIGWASLKRQINKNRSDSILEKIDGDNRVYFVHSFQYKPQDQEDIIATYEYGGRDIVAAIMKNNIIGLQFHPEKSGKTGLRIIKNFINS